MEATFFVANQQQAIGVRQYDDLPVDPIGDPLVVQSPKALGALAAALSGAESGSIQPLRDATCQSFPIFTFEPSVVRALVELPEDDLDAVAQAWLDAGNWNEGETDLYELTLVLRELQEGLGAIRNLGERLYILLEEKAY